MFYVYILVNNSIKYKNHSYIGFTTNPKRRLRQHNKEIKGGAKATTNKDSDWEFAVLLTGFKDKINALSCEWKLKHPNKNYYKIEGKIKILNEILLLNKWTNKCIIENKDCNYIIYIKDIYYNLLNFEKIPQNIIVNNVNDNLLNIFNNSIINNI